jgi:hypothetical protein
MATTILKGIKQVTLDQFNATSNDGKLGFIWFVRTPATTGATPTPEKGDLYFGTRHYGSFDPDITSDLGAKVDSIITSLGNFIDADGEWVGPMPPDGSMFAGIDTITDALKVLEIAVKSRVISVTAADNSITIGGTDSFHPTVAVTLDPDTDNILKLTANGLMVEASASVGLTGTDAINFTT